MALPIQSKNDDLRSSSRRDFLKSAATLAAGMSLGGFSIGGCSRKSSTPQGGLEKTLNIYNWRYYLGQDTLGRFAKEFGGVRINLDYYASNEECLSKLRLSSGGYDIVIPSDYTVHKMIQENLLSRIDKARMTNLTNLDPIFVGRYFDPTNEFSVPYMWGSTGFARNRRFVKSSVRSWQEMMNNEWSQHITVLDDFRFTLGSILLEQGYDPNTRTQKELDEAKLYLMNHKKLIRAFTQDSPKEMLISGDAWLSYAWSGDVLQATSENPALEYELPRDRALIFQDGICIPKDAPHPNLAHEFINFVLRPDVSAEITNTIMYGNPNRAARQLIRSDLLKNSSIFPSDDYLKRCRRIEDLGDFLGEYQRAWDEVKAA